MKRCFKCLAEKPLSEFYPHPQMGDGHLNKCKECTKKDATNTRAARIEHYRAYDRARGNRQGAEYLREYRRKNPLKNRAHQLVSKAVKSGKILPMPCIVCGQITTSRLTLSGYAPRIISKFTQ
jgi:hypothetical protein